MPGKCDVLIAGTGFFAERIAFDLAVTTTKPMSVVIGGRNRERMDWLAMAANGRAAVFGNPVTFSAEPIRWASPETVAETVGPCDPDVVVQAVSLQSPRIIEQPDTPWGRVIARAGYDVTGIFQAVLAARSGEAMKLTGNRGVLVNCCYPDAANQILAAKGLPVACGVGNVAILAAIIAADLGIRRPEALRMLAHHQNMTQWYRPAATRGGRPPRVWVDGEELSGVFARFAHIQVPHIPMNVVSGCSAVPVIQALAGHRDHVGHVPGPDGLPGGYPVTIKDRHIALDLPAGVSRDEAVAWNRAFEEAAGMVVDTDGRVRFCGKVGTEMAALCPSLADGFHVDDLEAAVTELEAVRARIEE
jgi:hypothetical protein